MEAKCYLKWKPNDDYRKLNTSCTDPSHKYILHLHSFCASVVLCGCIVISFKLSIPDAEESESVDSLIFPQDSPERK